MRRSIFSYTLLVLILFVLPACAEERQDDLQGIVTWVYDGDTLEVKPHGKVRLLGIDTPERNNSRRDMNLIERGVSAEKQRDIYRIAKHYNIEKIKGEQVKLELDGNPRDRHGRLLAYVHLPDGRILNRVLLENGLAVVYRRFTFSRKEDFLAAEERARKSHKGLWQEAP